MKRDIQRGNRVRSGGSVKLHVGSIHHAMTDDVSHVFASWCANLEG